MSEERWVVPDRVLYLPGFLRPEETSRIMQGLIETSAWSQERLSVKGVPEGVAFPRLVAWHGDEGVGYRYSGITHPPNPWTNVMLEVRSRLITTTCQLWPGMPFNGVLLNRYRDGRDSIGRHGDRETDLIPGSPICGISLGQTRTIAFRPIGGKKRDEVPLELEDGSLMVMLGDCQRTWTHEIRKQPDRTGERISMTFRNVGKP